MGPYAFTKLTLHLVVPQDLFECVKVDNCLCPPPLRSGDQLFDSFFLVLLLKRTAFRSTHVNGLPKKYEQRNSSAQKVVSFNTKCQLLIAHSALMAPLSASEYVLAYICICHLPKHFNFSGMTILYLYRSAAILPSFIACCHVPDSRRIPFTYIRKSCTSTIQ